MNYSPNMQAQLSLHNLSLCVLGLRHLNASKTINEGA